jgi:hypothetical protein
MKVTVRYYYCKVCVTRKLLACLGYFSIEIVLCGKWVSGHADEPMRPIKRDCHFWKILSLSGGQYLLK